MRKLIFLGAVLVMCMMSLTSCSKDDGRRDPSENLKTIDGTEWIATKAAMKFNNGKYRIDCTVPGWGTYTQRGNQLTFDGNMVVISGGGVRPTVGTISKYGDSMTVTFTSSSGSTENVTFTYNILAN